MTPQQIPADTQLNYQSCRSQDILKPDQAQFCRNQSTGMILKLSKSKNRHEVASCSFSPLPNSKWERNIPKHACYSVHDSLLQMRKQNFTLRGTCCLFLSHTVEANRKGSCTRVLFAPIPHQDTTHFPRVPLPLGWFFIHFQRGWAPSPFTSILLNMSNFTPKEAAVAFISSDVPGSCQRWQRQV